MTPWLLWALKNCQSEKPSSPLARTQCISLVGLAKQSAANWGASTIEMDCFAVLEAGSLGSRCWQGHAPPEGAKGESSSSFWKHQTACGVFPVCMSMPTCCSVLSRVWLFATPMDCSTSLLCPLLSPRVCSKSCPLSQWCYLSISSSDAPFSFSLSQHQGLFQWVSSSHKVAKILSAQMAPCYKDSSQSYQTYCRRTSS